MFLSFAAEPENNVGQACAPDRTGGVNGTARQFVQMWRHAHDRMVAAGASKVIWVWNVSVASGGDALQLYPGDAFVDWIAWEPHNWYRCDGRRGPWASWSDKVGPFYDALTEVGLTGKPWMLAEYGSAEDPVRQPQGRLVPGAPAAGSYRSAADQGGRLLRPRPWRLRVEHRFQLSGGRRLRRGRS